VLDDISTKFVLTIPVYFSKCKTFMLCINFCVPFKMQNKLFMV